MSIDIDAVSIELVLYSFVGGLTTTRLPQGSGELPFISIFSKNLKRTKFEGQLREVKMR